MASHSAVVSSRGVSPTTLQAMGLGGDDLLAAQELAGGFPGPGGANWAKILVSYLWTASASRSSR